MSAAGAPRSDRILYGRRRHGHRLRKGRLALLETALPRLALNLPEDGGGIGDPGALFASAPRETWLEIGFGAGEHLVAQAQAHPDIGFIGCEPYINGVASLLHRIASLDLANLRILTDDARLLIGALPDACLGRVFLLFPDPWPKRRHHKRRFVQQANLDQLARVMKDGAVFRCATDHGDYCRWTLAHVLAHPAFAWPVRRPTDWRTRPADWPATRYELRTQAEGRPSVYLGFNRRPRSPSGEKNLEAA